MKEKAADDEECKGFDPSSFSVLEVFGGKTVFRNSAVSSEES